MSNSSLLDKETVLGSFSAQKTPPSFKPATPEQAALAREAARKKREANKALGLRRDFLDANEWERLAHERKVRLPGWDTPVTPTKIKSWCKKLGWTVTQYKEWEGSKDLGHFAKANPDWPLRALIGLILEQQDWCLHA